MLVGLENSFPSESINLTAPLDRMVLTRYGPSQFGLNFPLGCNVLLAKLYPHLFKHCNVETLACDACELVKNTIVSYPLFNNKSLAPFMMIHSDV